MSPYRVALLVMPVLLGHHAFANEATWVFQDKTVGELTTQCPATFGSKAIKAGSPEYGAALGCLSTMMSLIEYLNRTGKVCSSGADAQEFEKSYLMAMKAVGKAAKKQPNATVQSIVEPVLRRRYSCT